MAFHLEGPWLTTTGKKRGPRKWASADAKKKAQAQQAEWDRKLIEFERMKPRFSTGPYNAPRKTIQDLFQELHQVEKRLISLARILVGLPA